MADNGYARYNGLSGGGSVGGVVTSLNGETGSITITSADASVVITEPTANTIDLSVPPNALSIGNLDSQAENAKGLALVSSVLSAQSADATHPGLVNNTTQTFSGAKTFSSAVSVTGGSGTLPSFSVPTGGGNAGFWFDPAAGAELVYNTSAVANFTASEWRFTVPVDLFINTNVTNPGMWFINDSTTGFYRSGSNAWGFTASGSQVANFSSTGVAVTGLLSSSAGLDITGTTTLDTGLTGTLVAAAGVVSTVPTTSGTVTSVSVVSTNGLAGTVATATTTPAITLSTTVTGILQGNGTAISAATTTGSGNVVLATAPTMTNPVVGTQSQGDSSTKGASTAYVDTAVANAVAGVNPAIAVQAATTTAANTSGLTYNNGVSGVGATFTGTNNTALTIDGFTFTAIGQRLLVKNDTQSPSGAFNGIYFVTQVQALALPPILTRALDYDTPSDMNNTGSIPVINGTVNGTTSWVLTSQVVTVGTTPLTFAQFTLNPSAIQPTLSSTTPVSHQFLTGFTAPNTFAQAQPAFTDISGIATVAQTTIATQAVGTVTTTATVTWSAGSVFTMTLTSGDTCVVSFSGAVSGQTIVVEVTNGGSGGTGVITWPTVKWASGTAPTMTVGTAALDVYTFVYNGSYYVGSAVQNLS